MRDLSEQITFRTMLPADVPSGLELCRASRWNQMQRDWEQFLRLSPHGCRVAVKNKKVIGTVTTVSYQDLFSWIGMVLVDPSERRQGIGTQLLREALDVLNDQRLIGLDATPAGREVYVKLGFNDEYLLSRMETVVNGSFFSGKNSLARQMIESDWQDVLELDQKAFGADRRSMLEWLFAGAPEYAFVVRVDGEVAGYAFGRHGFNFEHLGPVIATDVEIARQLISTCLASQNGRAFIIDAPRQDEEWIHWLESAGFQEQRPFIRMLCGRGSLPGLVENQFAILGPEFG